MSSYRFAAVVVALLVLAAPGPTPGTAIPSPTTLTITPPVLKWQRGGCSASSCQTGWYASPAVADLDNDGAVEVIWGSYDLVALNGTNGSLKWRATNGNRVWPGVALADLEGDGQIEIITGRGSDQVVVYSNTGSVIRTRNPFGTGEVRTLAVEDLENDGKVEIVVGRASGGSFTQLNVYNSDGTVRPGWPARRTGEAGFGWGMYNENVAVADMNGDGLKEIFGPTDTHYITALDRNGNQLPASALYGANKVWSQVGVHVDQVADLRGFAECGTEHRPNFANSAPAVADVNGDGVNEFVVVGDVYNCDICDCFEGDLYLMPWILRLDRTRWAGSGFDWTAIPTPEPNSNPLSEDFNQIEYGITNTVVADLDGDGFKEILYPGYDGRMHAWWLDKTQHGSWPYTIPGTGFRFASEPIVADLDRDGQAEVIFTSWPQKGGTLVGQLHILSSTGAQLVAMDLPGSFAAGTWNGGLGAPTIANIDADEDLELVVGTAHSGVVAYDLPNSAGARILWGTGRGSYKRTGVATQGIDSPAVTIPASGAWFQRNSNSAGIADKIFSFGAPNSGFTVVKGDWDGDGDDTPGLYDPASGFFFLKNANSNGAADLVFSFGPGGLGWQPISGDWNGDGKDTIGVYDPASGFYFLRNSNTPGNADLVFGFGPGGLGWRPLAGDWDGDGDDTPGLYDPLSGFFFLRNANAAGNADLVFGFGPGGLGWLALAGDWDGDGDDSPALYDPPSGFFFVRNANAPGVADIVYGYGPPGSVPLAGDWDGQ